MGRRRAMMRAISTPCAAVALEDVGVMAENQGGPGSDRGPRQLAHLAVRPGAVRAAAMEGDHDNVDLRSECRDLAADDLGSCRCHPRRSWAGRPLAHGPG